MKKITFASLSMGFLSLVPLAFADTDTMMGRTDHVWYLLPNQINTRETPILANRMDLREGRLRNPWPDKTVILYRNGKKTDDLTGSLLIFPTKRNEIIMIVPKGTIPLRREIL